MGTNYLIETLKKNNFSTTSTSRYRYIAYYGLEQKHTYVLVNGVVKTSIIQKDGREFNLEYVEGPGIISLLQDEISPLASAPFNVRVETDSAIYYSIPRVTFWELVNSDIRLNNYVKDYYRTKLYASIRRRQYMTMNGKSGAVCAFLYDLVKRFGKKVSQGWLINFTVTNEDIAGFCGITTRNSVNRILHNLQDDNIINIYGKKIYIKDIDYLRQFVQD